MKKTITNTYKPTNSTFPVWKVENKVVTRCFEFDSINPCTRELMGKTRLLWKHDTNDTQSHPMYHGCSYLFSGYNPTPCTNWFYGIPLKQMFEWCESHGMTNMKYLWETVDITYKDVSYESTHPDF